jgi:uncharacterized protein (TIGR03000 family)
MLDERSLRNQWNLSAGIRPIRFAVMRVPNGFASLLLAQGFLVGFAQPAMAQLMSIWGHPAFTIGGTPYDSVNQGHGEYPGSPGFIPGYGYYQGPGQYPWLDGPAMPFDRRQIHAPDANSPARASALVVVKLPADAELWFDDFKTEQRGTYREFLTPIHGESEYALSVHWPTHGAELTRSERVRLQPGQTLTVNFLTVEGWSGRRLAAPVGPAPEKLWPPRKTP